MPNKEIYTAESPISVKMLNGFVQDGQIEHQNEGEIWLLSKEKIQNLLTTKTDKTYFTKFIFNESVTTIKDGYTYYGSTIDNATVSSGTYYFYNCTGALTVSGKDATVYATNCPGITINGKTASNWMNIWLNGIAQFHPDNYSIYTITAGASGYNAEYEVELAVYESTSWEFPIALKKTTDAVCIIGQAESSAKDAYVTALTTSSVTLAASGNTKYPRIIVKGEVEL